MGFTSKIPRGFFGVGLISPKTGANVGGVMRASHCYGASFISLENTRTGILKAAANVTKSERLIPTHFVDDILSCVPHNTQIVSIDLVAGAKCLTTFNHPERAFYIFGPEDGTINKKILEKSHHKVFIPTENCMNLASCANVVFYDRMLKMKRGSRVQTKHGDSYTLVEKDKE